VALAVGSVSAIVLLIRVMNKQQRAAASHAIDAQRLVDATNNERNDIVEFAVRELRTPIYLMADASQIAIDSSYDNGLRDALVVVCTHGRLVVQILDDINNYNDIIRGNIAIVLQHVSVDAVVEVIVATARQYAAIANKSIRVTNRINREFMVIDETRLHRACACILSKAVTDARTNICLYMRTSTIYLYISVSSDAVLTRSARINMFRPMTASRGEIYGTGGSGMAVFIACRIIRAMGGNVNVRDSNGTCTVYTIMVPHGDENTDLVESDLFLGRRGSAPSGSILQDSTHVGGQVSV
jgi:signal transduction histidine kinase